MRASAKRPVFVTLRQLEHSVGQKSGPSAPNRSGAMKIFSICCVRDENDIVGETLEDALSWSDRIFVFDNASADGTWETVLEIARKNSRIEIVGHDDRTFTDELRGEIFESYRSVAAAGDWWCRLDSDEIYIDDPHRFLANVPDKYGFVYSASFDFYFTDVDLRSYEKDPPKWLAQPARERLKFYQNSWTNLDLSAIGTTFTGPVQFGPLTAVEYFPREYGSNTFRTGHRPKYPADLKYAKHSRDFSSTRPTGPLPYQKTCGRIGPTNISRRPRSRRPAGKIE